MKLTKLERFAYTQILELKKLLVSLSYKGPDRARELQSLDCDLKALREGYEVHYPSELNLSDPLPGETAKFATDVLDMFQYIWAYKRDNPSDTEVVEHPYATFQGYYVNTESDLFGYTVYLVVDLGRWSSLGLDDQACRADSEREAVYARMLVPYVAARKSEEFRADNGFTRDQILEVLSAATTRPRTE